ncbi:MAG TPA: excinuclease ABC subunit UvrC [Saprospiraceae bacterium]|nr:excinuclease ABC subunit UvrC [Saprospiraceae bacterium]
MTYEEYKVFAESIPRDPGVYRFMGAGDEILYVGKAKSLKNRLNSYFGDKKYVLAKTKALVRHARRIEFTITGSEQDALLLENSLIKTHQPRYNVMLKDGKTYAYICIRKEDFPRVYFTRKIIKDGSIYFGPYASKHKAEIILQLIKTLFPLRTCSLNLSPSALAKNQYKVCLEYHIKNCNGPCQHFESAEAYKAKIDQIRNMLKGHLKKVREYLVQQMNFHAERMEFEAAHQCKVNLSAFEDYQGKSTVVSTSIKDVDVFSISTDEQDAYIHLLKVIDGAVIHTYTMEASKNCDDDPEQILSLAIPVLREKFDSIAPEIIVPFPVQLPDPNVVITVPRAGEKKKLLELSVSNIQYYHLQKKKEKLNKGGKLLPAERILRTLQQDLQLKEVPFQIECFDNSNIQGSNPVAACVVFKNARPSKKDYRHFNIKSVNGPNDFASMEEVVYRRYKRLLEEDQPLPQLIIIDGGKGQLSSAMKSLDRLNLTDRVTTIGIAKKLEEIYFPDDPLPLHINKKSESLKLIQQLRNEAHRFGLEFHRNQRSRKFIQSELLNVKGIGEKTSKKLLSHFGSIQGIRNAQREAIVDLVGEDITQKLIAHLDLHHLENPQHHDEQSH